MYLTIHLILYTSAFVLFVWWLCTWQPNDWTRRTSRRRTSSPRSAGRASKGVQFWDFRSPIARLKNESAMPKHRPGDSLGEDYHPINRIHHYLS